MKELAKLAVPIPTGGRAAPHSQSMSAVRVAVFVTFTVFALVFAFRPHTAELDLVASWSAPIPKGDVICNWDTGGGFNQQEWLRSPLVPDGTGQAFGLKLPNHKIHQVRLRTFFVGQTVPRPDRVSAAQGKQQSPLTPSAEPSRERADRQLQAAEFDGKGSRVAFPDPLRADASESFSVSLWFRRTAQPYGVQELISTWTPQSQANAFFLGWTPDGSWRLSSKCQGISVGPTEPDRWYHVAVTHTPRRTRLYLNATPMAEMQDLVLDTTGPLVLGRQGALAAEQFSGAMGPLVVHHRELSEDEIATQFYSAPEADGGQRWDALADGTNRTTDGERHDVGKKPLSAADLPRLADSICPVDAGSQTTRGNRFHLLAQGTLAVLAGLFAGFAVSLGRGYTWNARSLVNPLAWSPSVQHFATYFLLCTGPSFAVLAAFFPGFFNNDAVECWSEASGGMMNDIHPTVYHLHTKILKLLWDSPAVMTVFQTAMMGAALAASLAYARAARVNKYLVALAAVGLGCAPALVVYNCYPQKDVLSSALCLVWALTAYHLHRSKVLHGVRAYPREIVFAFGVLLGLFATIRYNNNLSLLAIPLIFGALRLLRWRQLFSLTAVAVLTFVAVQIGLPRALNVTRVNPNFFNGMAMTNPLAALVRHTSAGIEGTLSPEDQTRLQAVLGLPLEAFRDGYQSLDANYLFYRPDCRIGSLESPEDRAWLTRFYIRQLGLKYPHVFMADRTVMFTSAIWAPLYTTFDFRPQFHLIRGGVGINGYGFRDASLLPNLQPRIGRLLQATERQKPIWWNSGFSLLALVLALLLNRWVPSSAVFALIVLAQVPVLFAGLPMSYFKYVHFLYPMGLIVSLLAYLEATTRGSVRPPTPAPS
ncbi:LamG domain-containing protein [Limnoglobus roseus]|uniref:LamG-like jellyroll fold domain-containing protein n=1 Tax=Limnoglobus roseus TaxID=2598579 RepID=A0A5C1AJH7_9BACT|nr:LamG domain-containing protein [Limnoglobus roseus]QEL18156.1 hypothetical protein PX52LOC_05170 [Limnoglobus roseus]